MFEESTLEDAVDFGICCEWTPGLIDDLRLLAECFGIDRERVQRTGEEDSRKTGGLTVDG